MKEAEKRLPNPELPPIAPRGEDMEAPLSFLQERLWLEQRFNPDQATYNVPVFFRLRGKLDELALRGALDGVLRRHSVLRGRIVERDGQPRVQIEPFESFQLEVADLRQHESPQDQTETLLLELLDAPFDLGRAPLVRGALYRLEDRHWVLALVFHQSVFDPLSDPVLRRELAEGYAAHHGAPFDCAPAGPPELSLQYGDFAAWQRHQLKDFLADDLDDWQRRLDGLGEPLGWPGDRRRPVHSSRRGAQILHHLSPRLAKLLASRAAELGVTEEQGILAALIALLARVGTHAFATLGLPVATRPPGMEPLIGNFDNLLVLALRLPGDPSFGTIAQNLRQELGEIRKPATLPYEQLVEALRPDRMPESAPFFRVHFQCLPASHRDLHLLGLEISRIAPPVRRCRHDLEITLIEGGQEGMAISFAYSLDLYERATVQRCVDLFLCLLESGLSDPNRRLSQLAILPPAELLAIENACQGRTPQWPTPADASLIDLWDGWVTDRRGEVAVQYGRERRTYGELDNMATALAHQLIGRGVKPGDVVGLCCPRSVDLVAACLGVLKTGAVVAPLDPEDPPMRLRRMLDRSQAHTLIAHISIAYRVESWPRDLMLLDQPLPTIWQTPIPRLTSAESAAWLFFTSGSTGEPKGVLLAHRNLIRLTLTLEDLELPSGLTFGQVSSFTFDAVAFEIWGAFASRGKLVGIERERTANAAALRAQLERDHIDVLLVTSASFHQLARQNPRVFADLPLVIFGGERAEPEVVRQVLREGPPRRLVNAYGPTEATTFATLHEVKTLHREAVDVPIGRPLTATTARVLDRLGQTAPIGVPGELFLGGPALALGYHSAPAATAAAFLPHANGERLYATGDLARLNEDLEFEFVGRVDQQVKIAGFRIELGEIEAALGGHPAVAQKVVVVQYDSNGRPHLIAFVVPQPTVVAPEGSQLRAYLRQHLPEFMVPSAVILLGVLPMTPHGKVDRRSLPHFTLLAGDDETEIGPRDEVEIVLERLWCEVMGADHVAIEANFFDLGGHSLLATQLLSKVRAAFGVDLPLREVFRSPTIAQMAELVREARSDGHHLAAPPLHRWPEPHPLSAMQERRWRALTIEPYTAERCSTLAAELKGRLDLPLLRQALIALQQRNEALRSRVASTAEGLVWQLVEPGDLPFTEVDLTGEGQEGELTLHLEAEARRPFLPDGLFWRCRLFRQGEHRQILAITVHRLLFDPASERLLWWNLAAQYTASRRGLEVAVPERPVGPGDWSAHRRHWLVGEVRESMLRPWRAWLEKAPLVTTGPYRTEVLCQDLAPTLMRTIRGLAQRFNCQPTTIALAAWCLLLAQETDKSNSILYVASSLDGRHYPELERILGSFESKIVLRVDTRAGTFPALVGQVLQAQRFALDHRDLSFAELIHDLAPDADPRQDPFCTTSFRWLAGNLPTFDQLNTRWLPVHSGWGVHARELCIVELPQVWRAELSHNQDRTTAERWMREWSRILLRALET